MPSTRWSGHPDFRPIASAEATALPPSPMVGELNYEDIAGVLRRGHRWYTAPEQRITGTLADYLLFKAQNLPGSNVGSQGELPISD